MRHLTDDPLPDGFYSEIEAAIVYYAQKETQLELINDVTYGNLQRHLNKEQTIDLCLMVGAKQYVQPYPRDFPYGCR